MPKFPKVLSSPVAASSCSPSVESFMRGDPVVFPPEARLSDYHGFGDFCFRFLLFEWRSWLESDGAGLRSIGQAFRFRAPRGEGCRFSLRLGFGCR